MLARRRVPRSSILLAVALATLMPGAASSATMWQTVDTPSPGTTYNEFRAVAALTSSYAWAVGHSSDGNHHTLIARWNGSEWNEVASPNPGGPPDSGHDDNYLYDVAVVSKGEAWAVGSFNNGSSYETLITRWSGAPWTVQNSPNPGGTGNSHELRGVEAVSSDFAWAVGSYSDGTLTRPLILRWNGIRWRHIPVPTLEEHASLEAVTAVSRRNAWAVGRVGSETLILHWNGTTWTRQGSPSPSDNYSYLNGVSATSADDAWAVGYYAGVSNEQTLILHWNGTRWRRIASPSPSPSANDDLFDVTAISAAKAWAVGTWDDGGSSRTLVLRWNGTAWRRQVTPSPSADEDILYGVAALSSTDIWGVGMYENLDNEGQTLSVHCC